MGPISKNNKYHICIITTSFPDNTPGSEAAGSFVFDFADTLSQHVSVTVLAPSTEHKKAEYGNWSVQYFAVPKLPLSSLSPLHPSDIIAIFETLRSGTSALDQLLQTNHVDHIFALWALPSGYWARAALKRYSIPYSIWALGSDIWSLGKLPLVRGILKHVLRDSHTCFADGYLLCDAVTQISNRPCDFLPSTRNIPSRPKQLATQPPYRLTFLGRWHPNKGVDILLDALLSLPDKSWASIAEVKIYGGGALDATVKSKAALLAAKKRPITVGGFVDKFEAANLLASTDYLIIPSRIESIPVVLSDAMKLQCPVICTPVGDLPRIIRDYQIGVICEHITSASLVTAIDMALNTAPSSYTTQLATAAKEFSIEQSVASLLNHIDGAEPNVKEGML